VKILSETYFIVRSHFRDGTAYIVAPAGWTRNCTNGMLYRDRYAVSPEIGNREHAHRFKSHRAAARAASAFVSASIEAIHIHA